MQVLITGAGMLGCHTASELIAQGDHVTFFDLAPQEAYVRRLAGSEAGILRGDIRELPTVLEAFQQIRPEVVIHTAGLIGAAAQRQPYHGFQINIDGTLNVAEAVRLTGVRRLIHSSTLAVHDLSQPQTGPLGETFPAGNAAAVYAASKVACEQVLRTYAAAYRFELAILRFASTYGYGHYAGGSGVGVAVSNVLRAVLDGRPAEFGKRMAVPDEYVYAKDVARGIALAVHAAALPHQVYNLGFGRVFTCDDVAEAVRRVLPGAVVATPGKVPAPAHLRMQPMDLAQSRAELGYEPRYDLDAGLADFVAQLRAERAS